MWDEGLSRDVMAGCHKNVLAKCRSASSTDVDVHHTCLEPFP